MHHRTRKNYKKKGQENTIVYQEGKDNVSSAIRGFNLSGRKRLCIIRQLRAMVYQAGMDYVSPDKNRLCTIRQKPHTHAFKLLTFIVTPYVLIDKRI